MTGGPRRRDLAREDGFVAGAESLLFGVLVFVIGTLIVVNAWSAIDAKFATSAAAREATRAAVEAAAGADLQAVATAAAHATLQGHGRHTAPGLRVTPVGATTLARCAEVGFAVQVDVPVLDLPLIDRRMATYRVRSEHRELVDPYRSGLPVDEGGVAC
jgi:hypothetical protein